MNEEIKLLRAVHGSARANGGEAFGRITFRLNRSPEARWRELFDAGKAPGVVAEERGTEFMLHVEVKPGEVASTRDALLALISDVNDKRRTELAQQADHARERTENKRNIEDALNRELEALKFERARDAGRGSTAMNKQAIVDKIKVARQELNEAEASVGKALSELKVAVRADKSIIGVALEAAFSKMKLANKDLVDLEKLIESALD